MKFFYRHRVLFGAAALCSALLLAFGLCFYALSSPVAETRRLTVVLDAGHGGIDGGVSGVQTGTKESDINLEITFLLQKKFEEAGFSVVLTRKTQSGLYGAATAGFKKRDMQKRAEIIAESNPALMLSVHQNFFSLPSRRGAQVFFREDDPRSVSLAGSVQSSLNAMPECVKPSNALKGDYFILNCSPCPAVIVECGFLSNAEDEMLLLSDEYREKLVSAILSGALSFLSSSANLGQFC